MTGHLLHVGYPKTGSTFLQRWFAGHPQLAFADGGIAGYRDVHGIVRESVSTGPGVLYRVTSAEGLSAPQPYAGQDPVDYPGGARKSMPDAQSDACATLAALFPNAHVLIVTRGFRSMILSSYSQYVRAGGDVPLSDLITATLRGDAAFAHVLDRDPFDYDHLITTYARAFGADQVIVMPYELLRDDADAFTRALETRLNLPHFAAAPDRINTSLSPVEMHWYPHLTRAARRWPIGARVRNWYFRAAFRNRFRAPIAILQRLRPAPPVAAATIPEELVNTYRGKAEQLRGNPLYAAYATDYLHE
jgi:hypothetical protein